MSTFLVLVGCGFAGLLAVYKLLNIHIIRLPGLFDSIHWTARSWRFSYPVPSDYSEWDEADPGDLEAWNRERRRCMDAWLFLTPYFASKGYYLYAPQDPTDTWSTLLPSTSRNNLEARYPFSQFCCQSDLQAGVLFSSTRVWPARNRVGNDVMIKVVSGAIPSAELLALRHLDSFHDNSPIHTIPVIEYIEFNLQVFAVMPRWDHAYWCDFTEVAEVYRYGRDFLKAVTFLHDQGISHGDIRRQNMVTDLILPIELQGPKLAGLRTEKRQYAFIDFETAVLPSLGMNRNHAYNRDIRYLAQALEPNLLCVSDLVPGLDHLLDSMKVQDDVRPLSAGEALARYEEIFAALDDEVLHRAVDVTWVSTNGSPKYRTERPVYFSQEGHL